MKLKILLVGILCSLCYVSGIGKSVKLYLENDFPFSTDTDYTHGTEISYFENSAKFGFDDVGIGIMQMMYAPEDLDRYDLITDDRPYCGLLAINLVGKNHNNFHTDEFVLTVGTMGKYAYAGETQSAVHRWLDCTEPEGWDNQLSNEVIVNGEAKRTYVIPFQVLKQLYFDVEPGAVIQAGNWNDSAEAFVNFRLGNTSGNVIDTGITQRNKLGNARASYWMLIGGSCKNVWHSTQLDGTIFSNDDYHVDSENMVYELRVGFGFGFNRFDMQFMNIYRTCEYTIQDNKPEFGVFVGTWRF